LSKSHNKVVNNSITTEDDEEIRKKFSANTEDNPFYLYERIEISDAKYIDYNFLNFNIYKEIS
jgi:hypothetical protein